MSNEYEITEAEIDSVLNYLKLTNPKQAKPEIAIAILERMHSRLHTLEQANPDVIEAILKDLEER